MCSRPSAFTATTPPSASWRRASARPAGSGLMCGMTGPTVGRRRRLRSITPRAIDGASIPRSIWPRSPVSCKPIATAGSSRCSTRKGKRCRSRRHSASRMRGGASSSWPISEERQGRQGQTGLPDRAGGGQTPRYVVRDRARHQRPQRRRAACRAPGDKQAAARRHARLAAARARNPLALLRDPETHELHAQALGRLCPPPRRWQDLPQQQRRRKSIARHRLGKAQMGPSPAACAAPTAPPSC